VNIRELPACHDTAAPYNAVGKYCPLPLDNWKVHPPVGSRTPLRGAGHIPGAMATGNGTEIRASAQPWNEC
jgi:hypothetical protein